MVRTNGFRLKTYHPRLEIAAVVWMYNRQQLHGDMFIYLDVQEELDRGAFTLPETQNKTYAICPR